MSLQVQPKAFSDAVARVVGAVERSKTMPILAHVMMTVSGGMMTLRGCDLDIEITTSLDCEGELAPVCAPADRLQSTFARIVDRGSANFSLDAGLLTIASGRSRFTMPTLSPEAFPSLRMKEPGSSFVIEGKQLAALFDSCSYAISSDQTRPYLNGIFLFAGTIGQGKARLLCGVATDGHMLSAREVAADLPDDLPAIILPRKAILTLVKMIKGWDEIAVEITDNRFIASFGPTRLATKLIEGTYPDWRRVTPRTKPCISYDAEVLSASVATAFAAVRDDKSHPGLKLTIKDSETELSIRTQDGTSNGFDVCAHSEIEKPPTDVVGLNAGYLLETIAALGSDTIQLGFADAGSPFLITSPTLTDRFAVIMPVRI